MNRSIRNYAFCERTACPGCRAALVRTLFQSAFSDTPIVRFVESYYNINAHWLGSAPYRLDQCAACGLIFQRFVGSDELLRDLYTDWVGEPSDPEIEIDTYREDIRAILLSRDGHELMAAASYLGKPLAELKVLDYGMGWALWARIAAALGCDSHGSDLAEPRMEYAAAHGVKALRDDELAEHKFDFINTEQLLEHVPAPLELLERLVGSLAPGGILKASLPNATRAPAVIKSLKNGSYDGNYSAIMPIQPLEHVNSFTPPALYRMARCAGLEKVRPGYNHRFAFLWHSGAANPRRPRKLIKELVRPWYQFHNRRNIYCWFQRSAELAFDD